MLDNKILQMKNDIIDAVRKNVMIKSVEMEPMEGMPFGEGVQAALENALSLSEHLGFKTVNLDNIVGYAEYGTGEEVVAVLGHLDVVPEGEGWDYSPYDAEIDAGRIYGRGVLDDKGPTIGALFALSAIKELNLPIQRKVRIIFGTNEETGSKCAKYYVEKEGSPKFGFTPDAEYPIINGEKGILTCTCGKGFQGLDGNIGLIKMTGGTAPNVVPSYAEAILKSKNPRETYIKIGQLLSESESRVEVEKSEQSGEITIKSYGVSAHGSTPELGLNAIVQLFEILKHLDFNDELKSYFEFIASSIGSETDGVSLGIDLYDDISGKLSLNLGTIVGDEKGISFKVNIRYPVSKTYDDFMTTFINKMQGKGIQVEDIKHKNPLYVDPSNELIKKLQSVYQEKTGQEAKLIAIGGGTYAKSMENIVAFGPIFPGEPNVIHQPNEYISIDNLIKNVQIIAAAILALAN